MSNKMDNEISWQARNDARTEQKLRELASDLADRVEAGELSDVDANDHYSRVAARWMAEV